MVKRIKRAQKDLVVTTSPRCYWSIRVKLYDVAWRRLLLASFGVIFDVKWIEKLTEAYAESGF